MYDSTKVTKNYGDYGGDDWWVEGNLHVTGNIDVAGTAFGRVEHLNSNATAADIIAALKKAGIMERDEWVVDADTISDTSAMPKPETIANTAHITDAVIENNVVKITLDCKVSELADADHGLPWGKHKWIGFAIETGMDSIAGITFTDATGATAVLGEGDIQEATALGIPEGGFVLYIKTEDLRYLHDGRDFTLDYEGYKTAKYTIKVVEPDENS